MLRLWFIKVTFKENHLSRRSGSLNEEVELLLLFGLDILNMGHTLVHILL